MKQQNTGGGHPGANLKGSIASQNLVKGVKN